CASCRPREPSRVADISARIPGDRIVTEFCAATSQASWHYTRLHAGPGIGGPQNAGVGGLSSGKSGRKIAGKKKTARQTAEAGLGRGKDLALAEDGHVSGKAGQWN